MRSVALGLALAATSLVASGCSECRCADNRAIITIPASRAADVSNTTASGAACPGTPPVCMSADTPCTSYVVRGYAAGACHVTFEFTSGATPVSFDFQFEQVDPGCCGGGYFPAAGTGQRSIPELTDAGAGEQ